MTEESKPVRVLLLDEDRLLLVESQEAALLHKLDLVTTATVGEAQSQLGTSSFDVAVMPARMAGTDGCGLTTELRQRFPKMAFVLISALHSNTLEQQAARCGARALLTKPIDPDRLATAILTAHQEQVRCNSEPLSAWDTPELWAQMADIHAKTGLVMSLATPQGALLRTIGRRNGLCGLIRSTPQHLTAICQTVASVMSAELKVTQSPVSDLCDAGMRRVVVPIVCKGELVGQVTGCGVATEPEEPDAELVSVQLGIDAKQADKLCGHVTHILEADIMQAVEPLRKAMDTDQPPSAE